jgi:tetratricopeptide (TPR) repeat protein
MRTLLWIWGASSSLSRGRSCVATTGLAGRTLEIHALCRISAGFRASLRQRLLWILLLSVVVTWEATLGATTDRERAKDVFRNTLTDFLRTRNETNAQNGFQKSADLDSSYQPPRYNLGILTEGHEMWEQALKWHKAVLGINPDSEFGRKSREHLESIKKTMELSKTEEGREKLAFERSLSRARALLSANRLGAAALEAERAVQLKQARYEPLCILADVEDKLGKFDEAKMHLSKALEVAPAEKRPSIEKALSEVQRDNNFEEHLATAAKEMSQSQYQRAAAEFASAQREKPWKEDCALRQGMALMLDEQFGEALQVLTPLLNSKRPEVAREAALMLQSVKEAEERCTRAKSEEKATDIIAKAQADAKKILEEAATSTYRSLGIYCEGIPDEAKSEIAKLVRSQRRIKSVAFAPNGGFVVLYEKNAFVANGIPDSLRQRLEADRTAGIELNRVTIGSSGGWFVVRDRNGYFGNNVPQALMDAIRKMNADGEQTSDVALGPNGGWYVLRGMNGHWCDGIPNAMIDAAKELIAKSKTINHVALSGSGGWCMIYGQNGNWSSGIPDKMLVALRRVNSAGTTVGAIAFAPDDGWLVLETK